MLSRSKILVAGASGLVGSAIVRELIRIGCDNINTPSHKELDFMDQKKVFDYLKKEQFDYVIDAAAKVGGINANRLMPSEFFYENNQISMNLIWGSFIAGIPHFIYLGSACMYPKDCVQPIKEEYLNSGYYEPTNEGYALAKMGGVRLCQYLAKQYGCHYISAIPANTYGIGDSFDEQNAHVIPSIISKLINAERNKQNEIVLWGSGKPLREFIYVDDLARGVVFAIQKYDGTTPFNIAGESEISMSDLAEMIRSIIGSNCQIRWDNSKPDGMLRRKLDGSIMSNLGWKCNVPLELGIKKTVEWYINND